MKAYISTMTKKEKKNPCTNFVYGALNEITEKSLHRPDGSFTHKPQLRLQGTLWLCINLSAMQFITCTMEKNQICHGSCIQRAIHTSSAPRIRQKYIILIMKCMMPSLNSWKNREFIINLSWIKIIIKTWRNWPSLCGGNIF